MIKWLNKSFLILTGICFALAILEIHGEDSHNTFFDQDDTYIQSNNQNVELNSHIEKQKDFSNEFRYFVTITFTLFSSEIKTAYVSPPPKNFNSKKIFLQNSVWRI
jgi:hypothetical protein